MISCLLQSVAVSCYELLSRLRSHCQEASWLRNFCILKLLAEPVLKYVTLSACIISHGKWNDNERKEVSLAHIGSALQPQLRLSRTAHITPSWSYQLFSARMRRANSSFRGSTCPLFRSVISSDSSQSGCICTLAGTVGIR